VAKMRFFPISKNAEHTVTAPYAAKHLDSCNTLSWAPTSLGTLQLHGRGYFKANLMVSIALCAFNHTDIDYSVQNNALFSPLQKLHVSIENNYHQTFFQKNHKKSK
jgi:hypothetical protein